MLQELIPLTELNFARDVSPDDRMAKQRTADSYFERAHRALAVIHRAVVQSKVDPVKILDFGCGHGGIARLLQAQFPASTVYGQEANQDWLDWCQEHLGIETILSASKIKDVEVRRGHYDLIWVGSVFTHTPEGACDHLLSTLIKGLSPGGVLVFTTAGNIVRQIFPVNGDSNLTKEDASAAADGFDQHGFGFAAYRQSPYEEWGRALISDDVMRKKIANAGARLLSFEDGGWSRRQDVYVVTLA